jgi:hypothetical protein
MGEFRLLYLLCMLRFPVPLHCSLPGRAAVTCQVSGPRPQRLVMMSLPWALQTDVGFASFACILSLALQ